MALWQKVVVIIDNDSSLSQIVKKKILSALENDINSNERSKSVSASDAIFPTNIHHH